MLTIEGLDKILWDYLNWNGSFPKNLEHNINGTNIEIILEHYNNTKETIHMSLTTLLIYANTRAIQDRDKIQELEARLDHIEDRLYRLDRYED